MNISKIIFLFIITLALTGCNNKKPVEQDNSPVTDYPVYYAQGFEVKKYVDYTLISVRNPWDTASILQTYILVDREKQLPANLPQGTIIRTPLQCVVAYSTVNCSSLKELQSSNIIKGVCESQYIKLEEVQKGLKEGKIIDVGQGTSPDVERVIDLNPEAIFASPIQGQPYGRIEKTRIPIIQTTDYTEPDPLGRAEWIRFYSLFLGKEQLADSLFSITVKNYNDIKALVQNVTNNPSVFIDLKYRNSWNMPGGGSYIATMLKDAGGAYVWADNESNTFLPLSFEAVLDKAGEADLWLIRYHWPSDMTYQSLEKEYKSYSYFKSFKQNNIWGCNTRFSGFYEDLPIHPDYILKEMASIFHPDLFPNYTRQYYKKLAE